VCWNNSAPEKEFWRLKGLTECFRIATSMASAFIIEANDTEPYFIFRGCVSVGDFFLSSDGRFFLGPAVDDAADMERRANGAFVFLSPSALSFLDRCSNYHFDKATGALIDYYVPLKNNSKLETKIVRPISFNISDNEIETVCKRFLNIFPQDDSDSLTKRKNTENMLRAILESDKTHITYDPFNY
jgi:hypothetical protein